MARGKKRRTAGRSRASSPTAIVAGVRSQRVDQGRRPSPRDVLADSLRSGPPVVGDWDRQDFHEDRLDAAGTYQSEAFWGIWVEHQDYLRRHTLRWMSNNTADAEDALSCAMLVAQRKYPLHAPYIGNLRAWLTRLVHNVCMDHHRSRNRFDRLDGVYDEEGPGGDRLPDHHSSTPGPDHVALTHETLGLLEKGLRGLSPTLREPFVLRCLQELSYPEIAAHLRITEAAVRKRVQLARDKLKLVLGRI